LGNKNTANKWRPTELALYHKSHKKSSAHDRGVVVFPSWEGCRRAEGGRRGGLQHLKGVAMIYGYIRVSTEKQTTENQRFEIENFTAAQDIKIEKWIEETISGTVELNKRKLGGLIGKIRTGDVIVASELSRLGRNLLQIMGILHHCMNVGATIWTVKDNYKLADDITSKTLAFAFGLSAEIERNLISMRTREALARMRAQGKILGRPLGMKNKQLKLAPHSIAVARMMQRGCKKTVIARKFRVSRMTVSSFIKAELLEKRQQFV